MTFISSRNFVRCGNGSDKNSSTGKSIAVVEAFFAKTKDLVTVYPVLNNYIDKNDKIKADQLHSEDDRMTYLACHTMLRLVLSKKLDIDPGEIFIVTDKNNKPRLPGDTIFFNISHTREAFAFVISDKTNVGIDLEKVDRDIDFESIIKRFFSKREGEFIFESPFDMRNRFFLLWTRKEALLKALGTGIISNLSDIEVFRNDNILDWKLFDNVTDDSAFVDHFIYSNKISDYYVSIAVSEKSKINMNRLDGVNARYSNYLLSFLRSFK